MACGDKFVGRGVGLLWAEGTCSARPDATEYKVAGAMVTKSFTWGVQETDGTADDNKSGFDEALATGQTFEISADGKCKKSDGTNSSQIELTLSIADKLKNQQQPTIWVKLVFDDLTFETFAFVTDPGSRSGGDKDTVNFTFAAKAQDSDFGLIVTPTP